MRRLEAHVGVAYVSVVALGLAVGAAVLPHRDVGLDASPFVGTWRWDPAWGLLLPVLLGALVVAFGPAIAARISDAALPWATGAGAAAWTVSLAASDGWGRLTAPLTTRFEYAPFAETIESPGRFLREFVEQVPGYPVHVQGHPPLAPLVPWSLDHIGLSGDGWFAALVIASWGVGTAAVLVAVRRTAGSERVRRAAPAMVLVPGAVWAATSADAMFAGVVAVAIASAIAPRWWWAVAGGLLFAVALLLTYGAAALLLVPCTVLLLQRRSAHLVAFVVTVVTSLLLVRLGTGFWWLDGLHATRELYWDGVAARRPAAYLVPLGNPTALLVAVGPATVAGAVLAARRGRTELRALLLPGAALTAVVAADLSLLSKGEVERIWLPFTIWLAAAAVGDRRHWLAAQAAVGLAAQTLVASPW